MRPTTTTQDEVPNLIALMQREIERLGGVRARRPRRADRSRVHADTQLAPVDADARVLSLLGDLKAGQSLTRQQVSGELGTPMPTTARSLDTLVARGLVQRVTDGRSLRYRLAPEVVLPD